MTYKQTVLSLSVLSVVGLITAFTAVSVAIWPLPKITNLRIPFTSQAPHGDWRQPWQDACEETSIIMVDTFFRGGTLTKQQAAHEILRIFDVKNQIFGTSKDESMEHIADIVNAARLEWSAHVVENPTLNDIREVLHLGMPVIMPIDARKLQRAPYRSPGPDYHVIVISGYDDAKQQFIAQDPGTSRGKNIRYGYDELMTANVDYLGAGEFDPSTDEGRKAVLFTAPR